MVIPAGAVGSENVSVSPASGSNATMSVPEECLLVALVGGVEMIAGARSPSETMIVTVSGVPATSWLSVPDSWAMYRPGSSGTNDGVVVWLPESVAVLLAGRRMNVHVYCTGSVSGSLDWRAVEGDGGVCDRRLIGSGIQDRRPIDRWERDRVVVRFGSG